MLTRTTILLSALIIFLLGCQRLALAETVISPNNYHQGHPDISGDTVTWKRYAGAAKGYDIIANSLPGLTGEKDVTGGAGGEAGDQINPVTNGINIVWEDVVRDDVRSQSAGHDVYTSDIYYADLLGFEHPLITGTGNQGILDIDGNTVVFCNDVDNKVYYVGIGDTNNPHPVSNGAGTGSQWAPRISGGKVVWMDNRGGGWNIFEKDISGGAEQQLSSGGDNEYPDISGNIVVWRSLAGGVWNLHWMNLSDGVDKLLTNDSEYEWSVRLSGSIVVWMQATSDATQNYSDLYAEDLNTGVRTKLADKSTAPAWPAVDQGRVVWTDNTAVWGMDNILEAVMPAAPVSLDLLSQTAFWASEQDYADRKLTVRYTVGAAPDSAEAYDVQVTASTAVSPGLPVTLASATPLPVGDIPPSQTRSVEVLYNVPDGVMNFRATVYAGASNTCGDKFYFPGPPPA